MIIVSIRLGELEVEVHSSESHPDHLNDINNRAISAFTQALSAAQELQASVYGDEFGELPEED
jgi:hypothetical protein